MLKYFLFVIFAVSSVSSQLIIVEQPDIENNSELFQNNIISFIDNSSAIILNPVNTNIKSTIIDTIWDDNSQYYILYKRAKEKRLLPSNELGTVIFNSKKYLIYKSNVKNLRNYDQFIPFDIVKLKNRSIIRKNIDSKINTHQRIFSNLINEYIEKVEIDSIWDMIKSLQAMERYTYPTNPKEAANFFSQYFTNIQMDTVYQDNYLTNGAPNVIAQKTGTGNPDSIIIVCSHYDVVREGYPGADDNGSGSSGNLEIARVLSTGRFKNTIRFVLFSGEELGLLGSENYAQKVYNKNEKVIAVLNLDMISYLKPGDPLSLDVCYDNQSASLYNTYVNTTYEYLPDLSICDSKNSPWKNSSDHKSFWDKNYQALYFGDDLDPAGPEHPNFHTYADTVGNGANSKEYIEGVVKSVAATVATLAIPEPITSNKSISSSVNNGNISFHTNKSGRKLKLVNSLDHKTKIEIFTLNGKKIISTNFISQKTINLESIPKGTYLLKLTSNSQKIEQLISLN